MLKDYPIVIIWGKQWGGEKSKEGKRGDLGGVKNPYTHVTHLGSLTFKLLNMTLSVHS